MPVVFHYKPIFKHYFKKLIENVFKIHFLNILALFAGQLLGLHEPDYLARGPLIE